MANRLEWTPGHTGKGFVLTDGSVWTWCTENMRPMHWQKSGTVKHQGLEVKQGTAFHIKPCGEIWQYGEGRSLSWADRNAIEYADGMLHSSPLLSPDGTIRLPDYLVEADSYGHATRLLELLV